jgi:type II secretory pathway component PulF
VPNYRYKAANSTGKVLNGVVEADSLQDAQHRLSGRGLRPLQIQVAKLPKPRRLVSMPEGASLAWLWLLLILVVLGAGALWYFDPLDWFHRR